MKLILRILITSFAVIGLFSVASSLLFVGAIGGMPFTKCGPSPKFIYHNARVYDIQKEFGGEVRDASLNPDSFDIISFRCGGFQDKFLDIEFTVNDDVAEMLLANMEDAYLNKHAGDNDYPFSTTMTKKTKTQWSDKNNIYIEYTLPSYGGYYEKTVTIKTSKNDPNARTHIVLSSYTW
jgi:hypothetical protein